MEHDGDWEFAIYPLFNISKDSNETFDISDFIGENEWGVGDPAPFFNIYKGFYVEYDSGYLWE